jgi:hypothetical protein
MSPPDTDQITRSEDERKPAGPERYIVIGLVILALLVLASLVAFAA